MSCIKEIFVPGVYETYYPSYICLFNPASCEEVERASEGSPKSFVFTFLTRESKEDWANLKKSNHIVMPCILELTELGDVMSAASQIINIAFNHSADRCRTGEGEK